MFKQLFVATATTIGLASAQQDMPAEVGAQQACRVFVPLEFTMWDLTKLEKIETEEDHGDYHATGLEWNFCRYLEGTYYFAQSITLESGVERLTDDTYKPSSVIPIKDEDDEYTGVTVTHSSDNVCKRDGDGNATNYSWTTHVMCDEDINGQGQAEIVSFDTTTDPCAPSATVKHKAGCHIYTASWF